MTSEKLAEFRAKGMLLDPKFDRLAKIGDKRKNKEGSIYSSSYNSNNNFEITLTGNKVITKEPDGYYYTSDGTFYGKHGKSDLITICSKVEKINENNRYYILYKTNIKYENLILVAGTAVGESSYGYGVENQFEIYALANSIINFYYYENNLKGTIKDSIIKMKAFAAINENAVYKKFKKLSDSDRNLSFFKHAIGAALNALNESTCLDYSNGATHWDGIDIKENGRKWKEGLKFQEISADIFSIGDNKKTVKEKYADGKYYERIYDYKWIATKGFFGINSKKKNPHFPYYDGDKINENKFGTVFMRLSNEYKNKLKYGKKKVE
ncbi:MAG: hypothetical protein MUF43_04860 [Flavobacterium sp.]|jgi:hypothetical protein|nr:hypothetical protein [Flavobacterium sp.]